MIPRRPFWKIDLVTWIGPDGEKILRLKRTNRRRWLPRAVAGARRLVRPHPGSRPLPLTVRLSNRLTPKGLRKRRESRQVVIVTTAAPPWLTGTSVNPLCRAVALAHRGLQTTIFFPWLQPANQAEIFPPATRFRSRGEQERWIRSHFDCEGIEIQFYAARFHPVLRSILPTHSVQSFAPPSELLILEEPEHLLAAHPWQRLKEKGGHVVGVVHTHYLYFLAQYFGTRVMSVAAPPLRATLPKVVYRNCHQTICLSRVITGYTGAIFENINGVRDEFFAPPPVPNPQTPLYFMGKLIWEKGFRELVDLLARSGCRTIDVFGEGESKTEILEYAREHGVTLNLKGVSVQPYRDLTPYAVFINPSTSEVLCTTTAEALAMGKFVIIPRHLSNEFFYHFPNCLTYATPDEFCKCLAHALGSAPSHNTTTDLTWDAATERFLRLLTR